jgi:hypothetical protein
MGWPQHKHTSKFAIGVLVMISLSFLITTLLSSSSVNPHQYPSTMGIKMHATITKEKPTRTTITPKQARRITHLSKSPHSNDLNLLLAEVNLPTPRLDNVLEAFRPTTGQNSQKDNNNLDNPCNLAPPTEKTNCQIPLISSPTGIDHHSVLVE